MRTTQRLWATLHKCLWVVFIPGRHQRMWPTRLGDTDRAYGPATTPATGQHQPPREQPANAMRPHTSSWPSPPLAPSTPAATRSRPLLGDTWFAGEDDSQSIWTACE